MHIPTLVGMMQGLLQGFVPSFPPVTVGKQAVHFGSGSHTKRDQAKQGTLPSSLGNKAKFDNQGLWFRFQGYGWP